MVWFGYSGAIGIFPNCDKDSRGTNAGLGVHRPTYLNDTGRDGPTLFTGEKNFTVKELEIFTVI
jgi:hypothetical protein